MFYNLYAIYVMIFPYSDACELRISNGALCVITFIEISRSRLSNIIQLKRKQVKPPHSEAALTETTLLLNGLVHKWPTTDGVP